MLITWAANGIALFGLKVLTERHLNEQYKYQYMIAWYLSGFALALIFVLRDWAVPYRREIAIGAGMALCSVAGQAALALALLSGAAGYLVFPITSGANVFLVAAAGFLLFHERIGPTGLAGIAFGLLSIVILSLS
jgi:drug/metabolite transporter (DMT)-like permease